MRTIGVMLMAYGGPTSVEEVAPFLTDIRGGRSTSQELLDEITERYRSIGGRSPILEITAAQAKGVQQALNDDEAAKAGITYKTYVGMRHWHPYIGDVVPQMLADGVSEIVGIVMAPHYSRISVGAYMGKLDKALSDQGVSIPVKQVKSWKDEPAFIDAVARKVTEALERHFSDDERASVPILFTAHSLPARILESGDQYPQELQASVELVAQKLKPANYRFAFQSQGATADPWLGPTVEDTLVNMKTEGHKNVLLAPIGFVCDHVEILFDVDIEHRGQAAELGIRLERSEMLNDDPGLIEAVSNAVRETVKRQAPPVPSPSESLHPPTPSPMRGRRVVDTAGFPLPSPTHGRGVGGEGIHILVAGGGISGLSAALALHDLGADVTLVEASDRFGGVMQTERVDDLLIDAGPDSFLSTKPEGIALVQRLGLEDRLVNTHSDGDGTFILRKGKLVPLPEGITLLVPTQFKAVAKTPLLSPLGKLRLLMDYVIPANKSDADESVGSFVTRRIGRQAFENMAEPLLSGIYAGDATQLSLASTFPRLRDVERQHGGIIRGAIAQRKAMNTRSNGQTPRKHTPFVSLADGMGELIAGLVNALDACDLRPATALTSIEPSPDGYRVTLSDGSDFGVDGVLLSTPAPISAGLVDDLSSALASVLREIPYISSSTISMAFNAAEVAGKQGGRGFVVPRVEGRSLTAITWTSNKFAGRVPEGVALLRAFVGRSGQEENAFLPEDQLIDLVRRELSSIIGITADPILTRIYRWPNAMPQYNLGHQDRLAEIDRHLSSTPRLTVTGSAYRGVGTPDCIRNAQEQAMALLNRIAPIS